MRLLGTLTIATGLALVSGAAFAQDTNASRGAANGAAAGGQALGPLGAIVGGVTGAAVGGAADIAGAVAAPVVGAPPSSVKRTTCVTDAAGNRRCDSVETTN